MTARRPRRARPRTWSLETLDRDSVYRLFFDPDTYRWEVVDAAGVRQVTRESVRDARRSSGPGVEPGSDVARSRGAASTAAAPGRHRADQRDVPGRLSAPTTG